MAGPGYACLAWVPLRSQLRVMRAVALVWAPQRVRGRDTLEGKAHKSQGAWGGKYGGLLSWKAGKKLEGATFWVSLGEGAGTTSRALPCLSQRPQPPGPGDESPADWRRGRYLLKPLAASSPKWFADRLRCTKAQPS